MDSKITIAKLNNDNYFLWKVKMQMVLIKEKIWNVITGTPPENTNATALSLWNVNDQTARAIITLSVDDNQLPLIMNLETAKSMWDTLKDFHEKSTVVNKMKLMRNMFDANMKDKHSIEDHIASISGYLQKLNGSGVTAFNDESIKTAVLLSSLPDSYRTIITSLEARDNLTWSIVTSKLIDESKHRQHKSNSNSDEKLLKIKNKSTSNYFCRYCKRKNHNIEDCRLLKNKNKVNIVEENSSEGGLLLNITPLRDSNWIFYSDKSLFSSFKEHIDTVTVGNGDHVKILGIGDCSIKLTNSKKQVTVATLTNVLFSPELQGNFISIKRH